MTATPPLAWNRTSLSVPALLRPSTSRNPSFSSAQTGVSGATHPRPQQRGNVSVADGLSGLAGGEGDNDEFIERWLFDEDERFLADEEERAYIDEVGESPSQSRGPESEEEEEEEDAWNTVREGSINRRPKWRRPRAIWIYPFLMGTALSGGMAAAPKSEIFINLACLSHPPRQPSSADNFDPQGYFRTSDLSLNFPTPGLDEIHTTPWIDEDAFPINGSFPAIPSPPKQSRSAADEWFYRIQRQIYEYNLAHEHDHDHDHQPAQSSASATPTTSRTAPSAPIPHPTNPPEKWPDDGDEDSDPEPSPRPGSGSDPTRKLPFHVIDPALCKRDPGVQAASARLIMILTMTTGMLTALTTGYWGRKSDRIGRTRIMSIAEFGFFCNDSLFILVASFPYLAPGGYRSLVVGPAIDGFLGGYSTMHATIHAYVSDVTPDGSRAAQFARLQGTLMFGAAVGPVMGSWLIKLTGDIMTPFYINVCLHAFYVPAIFLILPESLSSDARAHLKKIAKASKEKRKRRDALEREWENETPEAIETTDPLITTSPSQRPLVRPTVSFVGPSRRRKQLIGRSKRFVRRTFKFLQPLSIFAPQERPDGSGKNYNLTMMGIGLFVNSCLAGIMATKTQFTFFAYGWTSAELGPYMSALSTARGFVLLVVTPVVVHFLKPYFRTPVEIIADHIEQGTPAPAGTHTHTLESPGSESAIAPPPRPRPSILDLVTVRFCMFLSFSGYTLMAFNLNPFHFILCSLLITFGSADGPALNSLALSLMPSRSEAGRLFGGISVIGAVGGTLISPLLFGNVWASTVGWYAPCVFGLAASFLLVAQFFLGLIRLDTGIEDAAAAERGRSRRVKRVNSSGISRRPKVQGS